MSVNITNIPFDNIVRFGQQTMLDRKLFNVSWILGRFCNYNCSYCWPYAHSKNVDHRPLQVYKNTIDEIIQSDFETIISEVFGEEFEIAA